MAKENVYPVAFVTSHGHHETWCGAQESHFQIVKHYRERVLSITVGPHGISRKLRESGLPLQIIPFDPEVVYGFRTSHALRKIRVLLASCLYCFRLYKILRRFKVQIVYTVIGPAVILAPISVKLAGAKLVTGVRGTPFRMTRWGWVFRMSDRIAVLSQEIEEILLQGLAKDAIPNLKSKIEVILNGVDLDGVRGVDDTRPGGIRDRLGIAPGDLIVLYAAAFRPYKGQWRFIQEVLPRFLYDGLMNRKVHAVFLGGASGPEETLYESRCREAAAQYPFNSQIHFSGFQSDVWPWYKAADMVVLASENLEGMARVIVEAMACGKPVVCYDVCSARELLEASGAGIVVPQDDARGMADALVKLGKSRELREEMGRKAEEFAALHLDIRAVAEAYEKMFSELLVPA